MGGATGQSDSTSRRGLWINVLAIAVLAGVIEQVLHETTHAVAALAVGKRLVWLNFFACHSTWDGAAWSTGDIIVSGSAAVVNIVCGLVCVALFNRPALHRFPNGRAFVLIFGGFSLLAGFGYLMVDPLFYKPGGQNLGDWKKIVDVLGGGWGVRAPISAVGVAGVVFTFFWLPKRALALGSGQVDTRSRVRAALPLLLVPYFVVCSLVSLLALWHPLGANGFVLMLFKYWFGYFAFFWTFFMASYWLTLKVPIPDTTPLPTLMSLGWVVAAAATLLVSIIALLPSLRF